MKQWKKLTKAFKALNDAGFEAHEKFWCCQSCGCADLNDDTTKYVFYHEQDYDNLKEDGECYLAWGETEADGATIVEIFESHGLKAEWDGTCETRIKININS